MFRLVTHQLRLARRVVDSVGVIASTVASVLDPRLSSYLEEGQTLDGIGSVQIGLVRWIEDDHRQLEHREEAHRNAQQQLRQLLRRRDEQQKVLYVKLLQIRKTFEDAFGQGTAPIYLGLDPGIGEVEALVLRRYARGTINILSDPDFTTPEPAVEGLWENPQQYAVQIRSALEPFEATLDEIGIQKKEVEVAVKEKTELLETLRDRLTWSIRLFEALFHLAGEGYHADRLRPKSSRSTSEQEETPPDGEEPEEPAAETAPTEPSATAQETSEATA